MNYSELELFCINQDILDILLFDNTSKKNIIWATDNYNRRGIRSSDHITSDILLAKKNLIKPRSEKGKQEQAKRSKDMAEVFTPSWICNKQNNLIDNAWFGYENPFNIENEQSWVVKDKVEFNDKNWKDYVIDTRLEISCGEAPYLVSRYDTVNGNYIELSNRIGFFDRKMRVINENCSDKDWVEESKKALKSVYGYEYQGDNLLIARKNMFISYIEYYQNKFNDFPTIELQKEIATIISWNLWQMDGLKFVIPDSCKNEYIEFYDVFGEKQVEGHMCVGCEKNDIHRHNGKYALIMDWEKNKPIKFMSLLKGVLSWQ